MIANYHTHSKWCRHAQGEFTDYLQKAVDLGFKEIAITDHVCHKYSWCWLHWDEIEAFDKDLNEAIEKYKDKIKIYKGFECEYILEEMDTYKYLREELGYEFLIYGTHTDKYNKLNSFYLVNPDELQIYADSVCEGLMSGYFKLLAHPDVFFVNYPNKWDKYCERAFSQIFELCEKLQVPIEINTNGFRENRGYPSKEMLEFSKKYNLIYMINSDCHNPEHMYDAPVKECEAWVKSLGIKVTELYPWDRAFKGIK